MTPTETFLTEHDAANGCDVRRIYLTDGTNRTLLYCTTDGATTTPSR